MDDFNALFSALQQIQSPPHTSQLKKDTSTEQLSQIRKTIVPTTSRSLEAVVNETKTLFSYGERTNHPNYFSFIPPIALPESWLGNALTTAFNVFASTSVAAPGVFEIEQALIAWFARQFGLPVETGGHFVSGSTVANLTAVTVARDQLLQDERRYKGVAYLSDQAHPSVLKALRMIGLLGTQIRSIPSDADFRMDVTHLHESISTDIRDGLQPFLIIATCGTTSTGAIDPLNEIADIAAGNNVWLHVDGAHGAPAAISKRGRFLVEHGLGRADSLAWDAHKWLFQCIGCGAVMFRNKAHPSKSFDTQTGFIGHTDDYSSTIGHGIEWTRPARHMRLWFTLQVLGADRIDEMICHGFHLADFAEAGIRKMDNWVIVSSSSLAILTFRYSPKDMTEAGIEVINKRISDDLAARNIAFILLVRVKEKACLRICTINPRTTEDNILLVLKELDSTARRLNTHHKL